MKEVTLLLSLLAVVCDMGACRSFIDSLLLAWLLSSYCPPLLIMHHHSRSPTHMPATGHMTSALAWTTLVLVLPSFRPAGLLLACWVWLLSSIYLNVSPRGDPLSLICFHSPFDDFCSHSFDVFVLQYTNLFMKIMDAMHVTGVVFLIPHTTLCFGCAHNRSIKK